VRISKWIWAPMVAVLLSPVPALGWGDGGHEIIAAVAYEHLNDRARAQVKLLLAKHVTPAGRPGTSDQERFMHASYWADDVRRSLPETASEHFIDMPFSPDGSALPNDLPNSPNIVEALKRYVNTLRTSRNDIERAKALRFVIHYVGDIHQPLHCATRVTGAHPLGDRGGNDFLIKVKDTSARIHSVKLHSYWDGGLGTFPLQGPNFSPPPDSEIMRAAAEVVRENPIKDAQFSSGGPTNFSGWALESQRLAITTAYDNLKPNGKVSDAYRSAGAKLARRRVAWAGYRLAALLNWVFP
jgi:hypothetical protein